ncbi:hypothetical protein KQ3_05052 [Bacillus cereus B5-2]|nr:hypothetical protein ICS_05837 [Bacillus cereus BAG2O-3]EOQ15601.1 hypothetical protein KQ3_05052 [Bacillus cereus B5-2]
MCFILFCFIFAPEPIKEEGQEIEEKKLQGT